MPDDQSVGFPDLTGLAGADPLPHRPFAPAAAPVVFLIENDPGLRDSLADLLRARGIPTLGFPGEDELLRQAPDDAQACVVVGIDLAGAKVCEVSGRLAALHARGWSVIALTEGADVRTAVAIMKSGCADLIAKPVDGRRFMAAVLARLEDLRATDGCRRRRIDHLRKLESLSVREREVYRDIIAGLSDDQTATRLAISRRMAAAARRRVMKTMKADTLAALLRSEMAYQAEARSGRRPFSPRAARQSLRASVPGAG